MPLVTIVGLPRGVVYTTVRDPETEVVFEPRVTVEVDDATVERLKGVEQYGFTFYVGDPSAFNVVASPDDVSAPAVAPVDPAPAEATDAPPEASAPADVPPASIVQ